MSKMLKAELEHWNRVYRQLNKTPIEAPCDVCNKRIHPDRVQGCDNVGCGPVTLYFRLKHCPPLLELDKDPGIVRFRPSPRLTLPMGLTFEFLWTTYDGRDERDGSLLITNEITPNYRDSVRLSREAVERLRVFLQLSKSKGD